jgi:Tfp pilus assembly protein PilV
MRRTRIRRARSPQSGMSLIELMIAGFVLTVGMMGSLAMIMIAIQSNSRSKFDSTGTMVAQLVIEHINTMPTNQNRLDGTPATYIPVTDCTTYHPNGTVNHTAKTWQVKIVGGSVGTNVGADLDANKNIDWTQTYARVPDGYKMLYYSCGDVVWEARWSIMTISNLTRLVTVSSRQSGTAGKTPSSGYVFALPVTLRTVSGP